MSRFRKIETRIWNDAKFRELSDTGKLAFFLILTHPHMTALGAMRGTIGGLADELKWSIDAMRDAIRHAMSLGLLEVDEKSCYIGLPNFLRYNEPEGPNSVTKAWPHALELIPECGFKSKLIARCRSYLEAKSPDFKKAMGDAIWDAFAMPCHIQEPEQEQEQKPEQKLEQKKEDQNLSAAADADSGSESGPSFALAGDSRPNNELESALNQVFDHYKIQTNRHPKTYTFTPTRKRRGMARLRECVKMANGNLTVATNLMRLAIDRIAESDWHMGRNPKSGGRRFCDWEDQLFGSEETLQKWLDNNQLINQENRRNGNHQTKAQQRQSADFDAIDEAVERRRVRQTACAPHEGDQSYISELAVNS